MNLIESYRISSLKCECPNYLCFICCFTNLEMHEFQEFKTPLKIPLTRCHFKNTLCITELKQTIVIVSINSIIIMDLWFKIGMDVG